MRAVHDIGCSSGFGRLLTEQLLARGDRVAATARNVDALGSLAPAQKGALWVAVLDVTDGAAVRAVVDRAFTELGRIDVVVNNAGYALVGAGEEVSDEQIARQLDTNLVGSMRVIRAALPHLRAQGGGRILQVSSSGGQIAYPHFSPYHASKWGIEGFVEAAQETAPHSIAFTIVEPGASGTSFSRNKESAPPLAAYDGTPSGEMRRVVAAGAFVSPRDPVKMVGAIIDSVDVNPAPRRLALGSDAYNLIRAALIERLAELDAQKAIAMSADCDAAAKRRNAAPTRVSA